MKKYLTLYLVTTILFISSCGKEPIKVEGTIPAKAVKTVETNKETYLDGWSQLSFENESKKANDFFERVFNDNLKYSPEMNTYLGIKTDNDKWNDISDKKSQEDLNRLKVHFEKIQKYVDFEKLDKQTKLSYRLFVDSAQQQIDLFKYRFHNYPVNQMFGLQSGMPAFMINMHRIDNIEDAQAYIIRLKTIKNKFATLNENLMIRHSKGIAAPKFVYAYVISDSENLLKGKPFDNSDTDSTLLADFKNKISKLEVDDKQKAELIQQASTALISGVKVAYESLIKTSKELSAALTNFIA